MPTAYFSASLLFQSTLTMADYLGPDTAEVKAAKVKHLNHWDHVPKSVLPAAGPGREWIIINPISINPAQSYTQWGAPTWCTVDADGVVRLERMTLIDDTEKWGRVEEILCTINVFDAVQTVSTTLAAAAAAAAAADA